MKITVLWYVLLLTNLCSGYNITVEYYKKLIVDGLANGETYKLPTKNSEFLEGSQSEVIEDIGSYDFIIVGGGTAGSVIATRLSEINHWKILLLEAGGEENDLSDIPSLWWLLQHTELNWGYLSTPQRFSCLGMKNKQCAVPRGKVIGGSSVLNGMIYVRGHRHDYDTWGKLVDPSWSYENVLPYFKKSENSQINGDEGYHGKGGMWNVEYALPPTGLFDTLVQGNAELNLSYLDYNGRYQKGISRTQSNTKRGKRQSTATAFLRNARKRETVTVITNALVTKVLISKQKAYGVVFVANNRKFRAEAVREVILSAGAINTPQLLMLSGIGPKRHLEELGIRVVEDLPVGLDYIEHMMFVGLSFKTNHSSLPIDLSDQINQYLNGEGPLTMALGCDTLAFIKTELTAPAPAIEFMFLPPNGGVPLAVANMLNFNDQIAKEYYEKMDPSNTLNMFIILLHPKSRGRITLKSKNPIHFPNIDVNMLSHPDDIQVVLKGVDYALKLLKTEAFKKINASIVDIPICENFEKFSNEFWECAIRSMSTTVYHPCRTAPMGTNRSNSVVDKDLKVHGITNLRVVDASIIPSSISGHTTSPVVMIAEKMSDKIKEEHYITKL